MSATKKRLKRLPNETLKRIYKENDRSKYSAESIEIAKEILQERDEKIPEQEEVKGKKNNYVETKEANGKNKGEAKNEKKEKEVVSIRDKLDELIAKVDQEDDEGRWKYKIISGPILSGESKLQSKLNKLGRSGWELVDTQRHSMMGSQHAVCFLKKKKKSGYTGP